eukprot:4886836-Amphidinium_carterae.1
MSGCNRIETNTCAVNPIATRQPCGARSRALGVYNVLRSATHSSAVPGYADQGMMLRRFLEPCTPLSASKLLTVSVPRISSPTGVSE